MLPWTAVPMVVAPIAGALADRIGGRPLVAAGLTLQAIGLAGFATVSTAEIDYVSILPALILSGTGMALFFAPSAALVMASVRPEEQGIASGANNALREVGGALGVATLAAVFSAQGGYETHQSYVDGLIPALWAGAAAVAVGAVAALVIPRRRPLVSEPARPDTAEAEPISA
jgi:MFS family permease